MAWSATFPWSPKGDEIREQIGGRYQLLPLGPFECQWHRRFSAAGHPGRNGEQPQSGLPCERDGSSFPPRVRDGALSGLTVANLPDGRQVVVIPMVDRIGTVLPREFAQIMRVARSARGPVLRHAYETSLEKFQRWKKIGADTLAAVEAQQRAIHAGTSSDHESTRLERGAWTLSAWIFCYAPELYCSYSPQDSPEASDEARKECLRQIAAFRPFERAIDVVADTTGLTWEATRSAIFRKVASRSH